MLASFRAEAEQPHSRGRKPYPSSPKRLASPSCDVEISEESRKKRNEIAHSHYLLVDPRAYFDVRDDVSRMMLDLYDRAQNAALAGGFRL
jgi:hypothetical protein